MDDKTSFYPLNAYTVKFTKSPPDLENIVPGIVV